jgi:shikimate kinase
MNVFLIGYRGTGKSTVARLLAQRLAWQCYDADDEIEARAAQTIANIFATRGEEAFRDWESRVLADLAARDRAVLSLGGGAVLRPRNRASLAGRGPVVWLQATPEILWQRILEDTATAARRPNLTALGGITEIIATLAERQEIYRQCATLTVDTEGKSPALVADEILAKLELGER